MNEKFLKALRKGMNGADVNRKNVAIINSVISDLSCQVLQVTHNTVSVDIKAHQDSNGLSTIAKLAKLGQSEAKIIGEEKRVATYLVAKNEKVGRSINIAKWHQSATGFPCQLETNKKIYVCNNKTELERAIEATLEDPIIAEGIMDLSDGAITA